jgi:hypothetical protein
MGVHFNLLSNRSLKVLGSLKNSSFVATNEGVLRAMKKLGAFYGNCWRHVFVFFQKKT